MSQQKLAAFACGGCSERFPAVPWTPVATTLGGAINVGIVDCTIMTIAAAQGDGFAEDTSCAWTIGGKPGAALMCREISSLWEWKRKDEGNQSGLNSLGIAFAVRDLRSDAEKAREERLAVLEQHAPDLVPDHKLVSEAFGNDPRTPSKEFIERKRQIDQEYHDRCVAAGRATTMAVGRARREAVEMAAGRGRSAQDRALQHVNEVVAQAARVQQAAEGRAKAERVAALAEAERVYGRPAPSLAGVGP
jgi:hypothetical protein